MIRTDLSGFLGQSTALLSSSDIATRLRQEISRAWAAKAESDAAAGKHCDNWASLRERVAHQLDIDETAKSDQEIVEALIWKLRWHHEKQETLKTDKEELTVRMRELEAKLPTEEKIDELVTAAYHAGATDVETKSKMGAAWSRVDSLKDALLGLLGRSLR